MWRVSLLFVGACSFAFMPPPHEVKPACDDSYQAPVTDTILGGAALTTAVAIGALTRPDLQDAKVEYWLVLVPVAVLLSGSAVYGYLSRGSCAQAREPARVATSSTSR